MSLTLHMSFQGNRFSPKVRHCKHFNHTEAKICIVVFSPLHPLQHFKQFCRQSHSRDHPSFKAIAATRDPFGSLSSGEAHRSRDDTTQRFDHGLLGRAWEQPLPLKLNLLDAASETQNQNPMTHKC